MRNLLSRYPPSLSFPPPFPLRPPVGPAGPEPQRAYTGRNPLVRSQPEPLARPRPRPFPTEFVAGMGSLAASMPWRLLLQAKEICVPDFLGPRILHKYPITGQPLSVPAREVSVRTAASPWCALKTSNFVFVSPLLLPPSYSDLRIPLPFRVSDPTTSYCPSAITLWCRQGASYPSHLDNRPLQDRPRHRKQS